MTALQGHLDGSIPLTEEQIEAAATWTDSIAAQLGNEAILIEKAFRTIEYYDEKYGPLFLNTDTSNGVSRSSSGVDDAIHYAMIALQQAVLDHAYENKNVRRFRDTLESKGFLTANYFPGSVPTGATASTYTVEIDASNPEISLRPYGAMESESRRPTGAYAPPGNVVEITVPPELVDAGFQIRVGAHSWDLENKNTITRLDRVSLLYDIECATTLVSNPLGGGIYIEVPYKVDVGGVSVQIDNAVRSPFYAARSFTEHTKASEWEIEKTYLAPWADLEGDHFMIQVPTASLDEIEDPAILMAKWDVSMQSILDLYGITETNKTMLYAQADTISRGAANYPGYPMSNFPYSPSDPSASKGYTSFLHGPDTVGYVTFHELGHQMFMTKFQGETEALVHLPYLNFMNKVFGIDLETAFTTSSFRNPNVTMEQAFINWAVRPNFQTGLPMKSTSPNSEMAYQRRGYAKYASIVKIFGWEALEKFWASEQVDYQNGFNYDRDSNGDGDTDSRILRLSKAAGVDLRPILHVWGIHPEYPDTLKRVIESENLWPSPEIYDELERYKSLVPMTNEEFNTHARIIYPTLQSNSNTVAFEGWYFEKAATYSSADGQLALQSIINIMDLYFPNGRSSEFSASLDVDNNPIASALLFSEEEAPTAENEMETISKDAFHHIHD